AMPTAMKLVDALYLDRGRAGALDFGTHGVQQRGEVRDFRFTSAVLHDGFALGKRGGHQQVFSASDGNFVEDNFGAFEAIAIDRISGRFDIAVLLRDLSAQTLETFNMQIDGARTDGASAGQRDASAATARYERSEDERRGSHGLDQFIRRFRSGERARANSGPMLGASVAEFDFGAHGGEELACGLDVAHLRDVF